MIGWGTPALVGLYVHRSAGVVRDWAWRLQIPVACELGTRRLVVHAASARAYADRAQRRKSPERPRRRAVS